MRERRASRAPADREATDAAIFAGVDELLHELLAARVTVSSPGESALIAAYWPMPGEPDVRAPMRRWWHGGLRLALPRVAGPDSALSFLPWAPGERLRAGLLGTWEPLSGTACTPDVLLIPCLGFDERGYRLGYGGGFYDRTLAALEAAGVRAPVIGVAPECAAMTAFAPGPHDRPLDWIVTQSRRIPGRARG